MPAEVLLDHLIILGTLMLAHLVSIDDRKLSLTNLALKEEKSKANSTKINIFLVVSLDKNSPKILTIVKDLLTVARAVDLVLENNINQVPQIKGRNKRRDLLNI